MDMKHEPKLLEGGILDGIFHFKQKFFGVLEAIKKSLESGPFLLAKHFKEVGSAFSRDLVISCCVVWGEILPGRTCYCLHSNIVATDY